MSELKPCLTIEDAIEHAKERAAKLGDCLCAAEHAQLAEWLEELVDRRAQPDNEPMTCEGCQCQKREGWNYESCMRCKRHWPDRYRRKPEPEGGA